jgi:proline dehydrogenase
VDDEERDVSSLTHAWFAARVQAVERRLGAAYVAGDELGDALELAGRLGEGGVATTIGCFDHGQSPERLLADHLDALRAIPTLPVGSYLSVKPWALGFRDELFATLLEEAADRGVRVHLDAMASTMVPQVEHLLTSAVPGAEVSTTLPGRWPRSLHDAERVVELGVPVRVVQGQWACPSAPDHDPRRGVLAIVDRLAGRATEVAIATHDPGLARASMLRLLDAGTPAELELLLGLPVDRVLDAVRDLDVPVRVYVAYGYPFTPYRLRAALRDPRVPVWALRCLRYRSQRADDLREVRRAHAALVGGLHVGGIAAAHDPGRGPS